MHLPRTHRIEASAVAEQIARGIVDLVYCRTRNLAADVGAKRFEQPPSRVKVVYLIQVVVPSFWTAPSYASYMDSLYSGDEGLPMKPGGF